MTRLLSPILADYGPGMVAFWCPGCEGSHPIRVEPQQSAASWGYNGNPQAPTFTPSVLVRSGHYAHGQTAGGEGCWCTYNADNPGGEVGFTCGVCHSFVTDGRIHFLTDCTHALAGQSVPLPEFLK